MGVLLIDGGTVLGVLVALYARPTAVLGLLIGSMMLIPSTLVAPHMLTSYATVNHILIGAAGVRLATMAKQGGWNRLFTATPVHLAIALLIVTWAANGLAFAPPGGIPTVALQRVIDLGFVGVFFIVTLALCRWIDDPRFVMRALLVTFGVSAGIAVLEHFSNQAYGEHLFNLAGEAGSTTASTTPRTAAIAAQVKAAIRHSDTACRTPSMCVRLSEAPSVATCSVISGRA